MFAELYSPLWTTSLGRRAGWATLTCLILLFIIVFIQTLQTVRQDIKLSHPKTISIAPATANYSAEKKMIAMLPTLHLYGQTANSIHALPITSLQLRLTGILKANPQAFSRVLISENNQPAKIYQTGDVLSSGVKIDTITNDGVILENDTQLEKLPLKRPALFFRNPPKSSLEKEG